jgi:hypothetical protein
VFPYPASVMLFPTGWLVWREIRVRRLDKPQCFRNYPVYITGGVAQPRIDCPIISPTKWRSAIGFASPLRTKPYQGPADSENLIP